MSGTGSSTGTVVLLVEVGDRHILCHDRGRVDLSYVVFAVLAYRLRRARAMRAPFVAKLVGFLDRRYAAVAHLHLIKSHMKCTVPLEDGTALMSAHSRTLPRMKRFLGHIARKSLFFNVAA